MSCFEKQHITEGKGNTAATYERQAVEPLPIPFYSCQFLSHYF